VRMAQDTTINSFEGGLNKDVALVSLPSNQYDEANDVEFISDELGKLTTLEAKRGTGLAKVTVPNATPQTIMFRVRTYADTAQILGQYYTNQKFEFKDANGVVVTGGTITITNSNPYVTNYVFASDLTTALGGKGTVADNGNNDLLYTTITLTSSSYNSVVSCTQTATLNGVANNKINELILIRELITTETQLEPIAYVNSQNLGFVLSVSDDNTITEIGVADEDNNWAYTRLLRTKSFVVSKTQPIKFIVEQQNDGVYALYFTDNTIKDKCIYVPPVLTQDCCLAYSPTNIQVAGKGIYNLVQTNAQTNSQLVNNIGYVTYKNTLQSGGGLLTGGKRYVCRFGINGSNITTQWSILSNIVPVISASADSGLAWVNTQGTPNGIPTSKQNILTINNAQADVFNFVELGVVNYAGENATSGELIGRFDVLAESFDITHTGLEQTTLLDVVSLIEAEPVLLKVRDIETKKNRLNRANTVTANEDAKWQSIAENAVVTTQRFSDSLSNTGLLPTSGGNRRFYGYGDSVAMGIIPSSDTRNIERKIEYVSQVSVPPIVSPPTYVSGVYTVTATDSPLLQINLTGKVIIKTSPTIISTFPAIWAYYDTTSIVSFKIRRIRAGVTTDVINDVIDTRLSTHEFFASTDLNKTYNIETNAGDYIEFWWGVYIGSNEIDVVDFSYININQAATASSTQFSGTQVGEYQIPYNVANRAGYMLYEYYLTYVRFHLKNGYITAPYPLGKYYIDNATYKRGLVQILPLDPTMPFTDTSTLASRKVYNYALSVANLDLFYVKDELLGVSFERSEPLNTVIGSGIYHNARVIDGDVYTSGYNTTTGAPSITDARRKFGIFISNDLDNQVIKYSKGDYLQLLGVPRTLGSNANYKSGNNNIGLIKELLGSVEIGGDAMIATKWVIEDSTSVDFNSVGDVIYNTTANLYYKPSTSILNNAYSNSKGVAVSTTGFVRTSGGTKEEINTFVAFYIRPIDLNTVDYKNYKPVPTGEIVRITSSTPAVLPATTVYGGDTYTQKVIRKEADWYVEPSPSTKIASSVITFYAQNRLNSQLFYTNTTAPKATWNLQGSKSLYQYLFPFASSSELVDEQHNFDKSYIGANQVNRIAPYNPLLPYPTSNPTRIYYSDEKAVGSLYDAYRKVKPLNFVDLELQNGAISAIYDIRDVMVVIQPTFVGAIPYAADTLIQSDSTAKILVGTGTVYSNRVYPLSSFGTSLKTMSCKGYNSNGNPQVYWMSDDFANFNRYDYSGVKILSSDNNMRTWFLNNTVNIKNEFDVNIYYNTKKEDVVLTSRAVKAFPTWNPATTYTPFTYVSYGAVGRWKNFEQIPSIYVSNTTNTNSNPFDNPANWAYVDPASSTFYNMWSLIFNEKRNNFTTFMSPLQKRYFKHNNLVLTPRGVDVKGNIYQMDNVNGNYLQWFPLAGNTDFKLGNFILSTVFNKFGTDRKMINVNFERGDDVAVQPTTVTAITPTQSVDLPINETRLGVTYYPSYYDSNGDTPYGQFIKILIKKASYLKIRTIAMKFKNKFPLRMK